MEHEQATVEQLADLDPGTMEGALMRAGRELQGVARDRDHVVAPDHARIAARQHAVEVPRGRSPRRDAVARRTREPVATAREELREEGIELRQRADAVQGHFGGQAACRVCQCRSMRPFASGLWAAM